MEHFDDLILGGSNPSKMQHFSALFLIPHQRIKI
jgi:hypothetical protein